ncbi:MAG: transcriptional regulator NrdR [Candidatus Woesebacteria bacterium]|jgi:transcriptional repressor NrdR
MQCPYCQNSDTFVIDSREADNGSTIRRRRVCNKCQRRFTTYERVEKIDLLVVKKDGSKQEFDREKIKRGLMKATWKRPISIAQINELIEEVEKKLKLKETREVKSWEVGNLVINRLKKIDPLSYLLFACVYRDFESLENFEQELKKIR